MSNKIVQLENEAGDNIYPLAGGALTGSISKTMLEEGVFEGPELSEPSTVAYVATDNIQDGAVTSDKIDFTTIGSLAKMSLQVGTITVPNVSSGARTNATVSFDTPFKAGTVPVVLCMPATGSDANSARMIMGAPTSVTNTGFHFWIWNTTSAFQDGKFVYYAFGEY